MAYGSAQSGNKKFFNFKIVTKETVDGKEQNVPVHFQVDTKENGEYVISAEKPVFVAGNLTKIKLGSFEWKGEDVNTVQIYLEDGDEIYNVDLRYNLVARNIFNSLLSLESFENVRFELYTNKLGYSAVSVKQNGEKVDWKFNLADLPPIVKHKVGKKEVIDSSDLDNFFLEKLTELAEKVNGAPKPENKDRPVEDGPSVGGEKTPDSSVEDDDIPF